MNFVRNEFYLQKYPKKVPMFHTKKVIIKKYKTTKVINANRDIIGKY